MKLTPLADNVLLKHMEAEEKTASGIILSTANKEKSVIAEVIAAGPGTDDVKVTVKPGDKVKKGDLLMDVDLDKIKEAGLNTITPVLICNTDDYEKISLQKEGNVLLDEAVLKIS